MASNTTKNGVDEWEILTEGLFRPVWTLRKWHFNKKKKYERWQKFRKKLKSNAGQLPCWRRRWRLARIPCSGSLIRWWRCDSRSTPGPARRRSLHSALATQSRYTLQNRIFFRNQKNFYNLRWVTMFFCGNQNERFCFSKFQNVHPRRICLFYLTRWRPRPMWSVFSKQSISARAKFLRSQTKHRPVTTKDAQTRNIEVFPQRQENHDTTQKHKACVALTTCTKAANRTPTQSMDHIKTKHKTSNLIFSSFLKEHEINSNQPQCPISSHHLSDTQDQKTIRNGKENRLALILVSV